MNKKELESEGFEEKKHLAILQLLMEGPSWPRQIEENLRSSPSIASITKYLEELEKLWHLVTCEKKGKKKVYTITELGKDVCVFYQIKTEAGYIGIRWAEKLLDKNYKIRFLFDLTNISNHKSILFAWNPITKDIKLANLFNLRQYPEDRWQAYKVEEGKATDKTSLREFLLNNDTDFRNEEDIEKSLGDFFNLDNYNVFQAMLMPKNIVPFGFPDEIGHWGYAFLLGFGWQEAIPNINRISIAASGIKISNNLWMKIIYEMNPSDLFNYANDVINQYLVESEKKPTIWLKMIPRLSCNNNDKGMCNKMEIPCLAQVENKLHDFKNCPIIMNDLRAFTDMFEKE